MTLGRKLLLTGAFLVGFVILGWGMIFAAIYATGGVATIALDSPGEGVAFYLPMPVAAVNAALAVGGRAAQSELAEFELEFGDWGPFVDAGLEALDDAPDFTMIEVIDGDDHVQIRKEGGGLQIRVDSDGDALRMSIPLRGIRGGLSRLL